jgi:hypothetical protein
MARLQGQHLEDVALDPHAFSRIRNQAEAFEMAVAPRRLAALLLDPADLGARVAAFLEKLTLSDVDLERRARDVWSLVDGLASADLDRLLTKIPLSRLRTYTDRHLRTLAQQFMTWDPLLRFVEGRGLSGAEATAANAALADLLRRLASRLGRFWAGEMAGFDAEDAVQEAVMRTLETAEDPYRGYSYEGDLFGWLFHTAHNQLKARMRVREFPTLLGPSAHQEHAVASEVEYAELLQQFQQRYLLVETFFRDPVRDRVKAIWKSMLRSDHETDDLELANWIERESGLRVPVATLAGTRRRLRQRMGALTIVLDDTSGWAIDAPGDVAVLDHIRSRWGLAAEDVPTVRHLAALGRAARCERSLAWVLLARLLIDLQKDFDEAWRAVDPMLSRGEQVSLEFDRRRNHARSWTQQPANMLELAELRKRTRNNRVGFLVSPCWCLAVLRGVSGPEVALALHPAQDEEQWIHEIVAHLQAGWKEVRQ